MYTLKKLTFKYNKEADALSTELYLRGEISSVEIPSSSIDEWMNDSEKKDLFRPATTSFLHLFSLRLTLIQPLKTPYEPR